MTTPLIESPPPPEPVQEEAPRFGDPVGVGKLLDPATSDEAICKLLHDEWAAQREAYARRLCEAEVNARRRKGESNIWVEKAQDTGLFRVYVPFGSSRYSQFYQKANRLCLRFVSYLYPDPAKPEAIPTTGEAADRDAAEFATRVLADLASEASLNDLDAHKQAQDLACNWGRAYIWYFTDPQGGGRQPIEIEAAPFATSVDDALTGPDGMPYTGPTVIRYVRPDGSLTDTPAEAALRWHPKLTRKVCDPGAVRLLPATAADLWEATGLLYAAYHPWATLKTWFPALAERSIEDRDHAIKFRLPDAQHLLPKKGWKPHDPAPKKGQEESGLALLMCRWDVENPEYPDGCYVVTVGDRIVAHRGEWVLRTDTRREPRDLPFTEVVQWRDAGLMDFLGPSNETRGEVYGRILDMLDKLLNRKILLPFGSTLQPQDFQNPFATTLNFQPGYEPKYEDVADVPKEAFALLDRTGDDMNDASGLQEAGQGLQVPGVNSGRQALAIVSQVQAGLADVNQNANKAFVRAWRVQLQEMRLLDAPALIRFIDRDGDYKVKRWLASDLGSTRDVQVQRGTGTLLTPMQKVELVQQYQQMTGLPVEDVQDLLSSGFSPYTAMQDNKHLLRVRKQIMQWEEGPPDEWQPPAPPTLDPLTGAPIPPAPDPVLATIFDPRPVDVAPVVAKVRVRELGLAMASGTYGTKPPAWRAGLDQEYQRMVQALTPPAPMPPPEAGKGPMPSPGQPPELTAPEAAVLGPSTSQPAGARAVGG